MKFGNTRLAKVVPVVGLAAYSAGQVVGGVQSIDKIGSISGVGLLKHVSITDAANQKPVLSLLFFKALPTGTWADAGAPTPSAADLGNFVGKVEIGAGDWATFGSKGFCTKECSIVIKADGNQILYMVVIATATPDFAAADDLKFQLGMVLD